MKTKFFAALALLLGIAGVAYAQSITLPQVPTVGPTDLFQDVVNGQPLAQSQYTTAAGILSTSNYIKTSPLTGTTYTFANTQTRWDFAGATTVATMTVKTPPAPSDGDEICWFSLGAVTTLTITANTGQTVNNAATSMSANTRLCYIYSASNLTWDRTN